MTNGAMLKETDGAVLKEKERPIGRYWWTTRTGPDRPIKRFALVVSQNDSAH
jgi:hypothetical protein